MPTSREEVMEILEDSEALLWDGFEGALIGYCERCTLGPVALYDHDKCIKILMERDGMDEDSAEEYFEYNVVGAYIGDKTPMIATLGE